MIEWLNIVSLLPQRSTKEISDLQPFQFIFKKWVKFRIKTKRKKKKIPVLDQYHLNDFV